MKGRTTLWLFVAVCLMGLIAVCTRPSRRAEGRELGRKLWNRQPLEDTTYLLLDRGTFEVECQKTHEGWFVTSPVRARASEARIELVISALSEQHRSQVVTSQERSQRDLELDDYCVGVNSSSRLVIGDGRRRTTLLVGRPSPLGEEVYVRFASEIDVIATETNILSALPSSVDDVRECAVFSGDPALVRGLEIERTTGGFIKIGRQDADWIMSQPQEHARLDPAAVNVLVGMLYGLRASRFLGVEEAQLLGVSEQAAVGTVTLWRRNSTVGQRVLFGAADSESGRFAFALVPETGLASVVDDSVLDILSINTDQLRETRVFDVAVSSIERMALSEGDLRVEMRRNDGGWFLREPRHLKADEAVLGELASRLSLLEVIAFVPEDSTDSDTGLEDATRMIEVEWRDAAGVSASADAATVRSRTLVLGNAADGGGIYARVEGEPSSFVLGGTHVVNDIIEGRYVLAGESEEGIWEKIGSTASTMWVNPLLYCDRTVLELPPADIQSVTIDKHSVTQTVRRATAGWESIRPAGASVVMPAVAKAVSTAAGLRASRLVRHEPKDGLMSFGLDKPVLKVVYGLSGRDAISKTLVFGFLAGTDSVYVMVQGQDIVFVVPRRVADELAQDITQEVEDGD